MAHHQDDELLEEFQERIQRHAIRLAANRDGAEGEMRQAANQVVQEHARNVVEEAQVVADRLQEHNRAREDFRQRLRQDEINVALEFNEDARMLAIGNAVDPAARPPVKPMFTSISAEVSNISESFKNIYNRVNVGIKEEKATLVQGQLGALKSATKRMTNCIVKIIEKYLEIIRYGPIDDNDLARNTEFLRLKTYAEEILVCFDHIDKIIRSQTENASTTPEDSTWLTSLKGELDGTKGRVDVMVGIWNNVPKPN